MHYKVPVVRCKELHVPHLSRTFETHTILLVQATPEPIFFSQSLDTPEGLNTVYKYSASAYIS